MLQNGLDMTLAVKVAKTLLQSINLGECSNYSSICISLHCQISANNSPPKPHGDI